MSLWWTFGPTTCRPTSSTTPSTGEDHYVIRAHALGNFRDLIEASAKSPSMLDFLSNRYSDGNNPNENYARELLELHTVGSYSYVPGPGYRTQPQLHRGRRASAGAHLKRLDQLSLAPTTSFTLTPAAVGQGTIGRRSGSGSATTITSTSLRAALNKASKCSTSSWSTPARRISSPSSSAGASSAITQTCSARRPWKPARKRSCNLTATSAKPWRAILLHPKFAQSWGQKVKRPFEFFISTLRALGITEMINFLPDNWNALGERRFAQMNELLGQDAV
ncbi:MAG: hypothetical protein KatS3mg052_0999 [Candidatus Roseilinea sp.]|nr:MAG: hypothetical protein KatS3mg052_0999 [Candidatus Roseilinea sp.]